MDGATRLVTPRVEPEPAPGGLGPRGWAASTLPTDN